MKEAAGDHFDDLELNALIGFAIVTDGAAALHVPVALAGTLDEMAEELGWRREDDGIS